MIYVFDVPSMILTLLNSFRFCTHRVLVFERKRSILDVNFFSHFHFAAWCCCLFFVCLYLIWFVSVFSYWRVFLPWPGSLSCVHFCCCFIFVWTTLLMLLLFCYFCCKTTTTTTKTTKKNIKSNLRFTNCEINLFLKIFFFKQILG